MSGGGWSPLLLVLVLGFGCMQSGDTAAPPPPNSFAPASAPNPTLAGLMDRTFVPGKRIGLLEVGMPMAGVEKEYGSAEIEARELPAGEGTTVPGYLVFPGTQDEFFVELGSDKQPARIRISEPRSRWTGAENGLKVGTLLHELQEMNGRPFEFRGFGWDYGGTVTDWRGGRLGNVSVRLGYAPERIDGRISRDSLLGDRPLMSDREELRGLGIAVREISFSLRSGG